MKYRTTKRIFSR